MRLQDLAKQMREFAEKHPYLLKSGDLAPGGAHRQINYKGKQINVVFTLDVLTDEDVAWHLSLGDETRKPLPPEMVDEFVTVFFGDDQKEVTQLPPILDGQIQFIRIIRHVRTKPHNS
jgi:hypothetical protein